MPFVGKVHECSFTASKLASAALMPLIPDVYTQWAAPTDAPMQCQHYIGASGHHANVGLGKKGLFQVTWSKNLG